MTTHSVLYNAGCLKAAIRIKMISKRRIYVKMALLRPITLILVLNVVVVQCTSSSSSMARLIRGTVCDKRGQQVSQCNCTLRQGAHGTSDDTFLVDCSSRELLNIPAKFPSNTLVLNLLNNSLTNIPSEAFLGLNRLQSLLLQDNFISDIRADSFLGLNQLTQLYLKNNTIREIKSRTFEHLPNLRKLHLEDNFVKTIAGDAFVGSPKIEEIILRNNPLICYCNAKYLKDWWSQQKQLFIIGARCINLNSQILVQIQDNEFGDCPDPGWIQCYNCVNRTSDGECISKGTIQQCASYQNSCETITRVVNGEFTLSKQCQEGETCSIHSVENSRHCTGERWTKCSTCCQTALCNSKSDITGFINEWFYNVTIYIQDELSGEESKINSLAAEIIRVLGSASKQVEGIHVITISAISAWPQKNGILQCDGVLKATVLADQIVWGIAATRDKMYHAWLKSLTRGDLDTINIDRDLGFAIERNDLCTANYTQDLKGVLYWKSIEVGKEQFVHCPNATSLDVWASRKCLQGPNKAVWDDANTVKCRYENARTEDLANLADTVPNKGNAESIMDTLANISKQAPDFNHQDISYTVAVLENMVDSSLSGITVAVVSDCASVISDLLNSNPDDLITSQRNTQSLRRLVQSVDTFLEEIPGMATIVQPNFGLAVNDVNPTMFRGAVFQTTRQPSTNERLSESKVKVNFNGTSGTSPDQEADISLTLPKSIFTDLNNTVPSRNQKIKFVVYQSDKFFSAQQVARFNRSDVEARPITDDAVTMTTQGTTRSYSFINSRVVAASIGKLQIKNLVEPVVASFKHIEESLYTIDGKEQKAETPRCVFWDFDLNDKNGGWSEEGCRVRRHVPNNFTECECDHLTNFALLMDVYGNIGQLSEGNKMALSIISYIGCGISLLALTATLLTYLIFKKLRKDNPSKILINLCAALFTAVLLFVIGSIVTQTGIGCQVVAVLLHYFLLATFTWMAVEAFYMYLALVKVFQTYYSKFILKCCAVGWGVPLVPIIVTLSISPGHYGLHNGICWLDRLPFYCAFLAPVGIILIINLIAFVLVIHQLMGYSAKKLNKTERSNTAIRLRGAISIVVLLGLTWLFALFSIGGANIVFSYLFAVFNSLQGLFIFVFYCVLKRDVQMAWLRCCCKDRVLESTSKSHSTASKGQTSSTPLTKARFKAEFDNKNGRKYVSKGHSNHSGDVNHSTSTEVTRI
ncbi:unnamed protein product [Owenia fusiformis]|uniref:Adhesion G-protein coupled receptor G6 n=1 Tax=Owenia fusiformis TaxID=6347 RepID=A0A8J1XJ68_OWEFU|nr:unnamed protein product [Owenia fusiformis]